jgi:RNA polymerase sigma factor (sigma-70 family)
MIQAVRADPELRDQGRECLSILYERYAWRILLRLRRLAPAVADDLLHDTWVRVTVSLPTQYREETRFLAWVFQIANNLARDWYRRKKGESLSGIDHPDEGVPPIDSMIAVEHRVKLRECIEDLPDDQRVVVQERLNGVAPETLSQRLNIARGTVDTRYSRAVDKLRKCMDD